MQHTAGICVCRTAGMYTLAEQMELASPAQARSKEKDEDGLGVL